MVSIHLRVNMHRAFLFDTHTQSSHPDGGSLRRRTRGLWVSIAQTMISPSWLAVATTPKAGQWAKAWMSAL